MAVISPVPKLQFFDANGNPLAGGKLYSYAAGTTTPQATFTDAGGGTPNTNPVILDSRGEASVWLGSSAYKLKLTTVTDVEIWTVDNVAGAATLAQLAASGGSSLVGFLQAGTGAVERTAQAKMRDVVSVKDFGAVGNGVADDTVAIQTAINSLPNGGYCLLPSGTYLVTSTITVATDRVHLVGQGIGATLIKFQPTANAVCLKVEKGAAVIYQGSIRDISFYSTDTTYTKTAIQLIDHSGYVVERCGTVFPHIKGAGSIFLNIKGREAGSIQEIYAAADRCLVCDPIPAPHVAAGIGLDHHNFHNIYFTATGSYPIVTFADGLLLTQVSFTGHQAWVGGTHGLYWLDTTTTAISNGLSLQNVRWEGGVASSHWLVNIQHNSALQGLMIRDCQGGDRNGIYLRKVENVLLENFWYTSATLTALDINSTVKRLTILDCFWQAGSTANVSGQRVIFSTPKNPNTGALPPNIIYDESTNAVVDTDFGGRINANFGQIKFPATQNPSSDANTLDDYEEGTFTPTWTPASGSGQTIANASGWYTKIGNRVFVDIWLATNGHGTASGNITIGDLPFVSTVNSGQLGGFYVVEASSANLGAAGQSGAARIIYNTNTIQPIVWKSTGGTSPLQVSEWGVSGTWRFTGSYQTTA